MNIKEIIKIMPHRYPFLLVDKIIEIEPGSKAIGIKNVSVNEPQFQGHFPEKPVMPGVLLIEAIAQVGACALLCQSEYQGKNAFLAGVDHFRFKRQVQPGDVLVIISELLTIKGHIGRGKGSISCEGNNVCSGEFLFAIQDEGGS